MSSSSSLSTELGIGGRSSGYLLYSSGYGFVGGAASELVRIVYIRDWWLQERRLFVPAAAA